MAWLDRRSQSSLRAIVAGLAISLASATVWGTRAEQSPGAAVEASCRSTVTGPDRSLPVEWITPDTDRKVLDRWCGAVGPVAVHLASARDPRPVAQFVVISWNVHVGGGDVDRVVDLLKTGALTGGHPVSEFVLLLQEAYRGGDVVPRPLQSLVEMAGLIRPATPSRTREDITAVATRRDLNLYYVPSMRNGPLASSEDRGNAILTTFPLAGLRAVELPLERQRRVVVVATAHGRSLDGGSWSLTLASAHLDNLIGLRYVWLFSAAARQRQARALASALQAEAPTIIGADMNSWLGFRDPAYLVLAGAYPASPLNDRRATFAGLLRLDHVFARLPRGWRSNLVRLDDKFGSDHYPLMARVTVPDAAAGSGDRNETPHDR